MDPKECSDYDLCEVKGCSVRCQSPQVIQSAQKGQPSEQMEMWFLTLTGKPQKQLFGVCGLPVNNRYGSPLNTRYGSPLNTDMALH